MLLNMLFHATLIGLCVLVFAGSRFYGGIWLAALIFLLLSAASLVGYFAVLRWLDRRPLERSENLLSELCRAS